MPKLLLFAPCEKVITDHDSNTVSLITIMQDLAVSVPPNVQLPEKARAAIQWCGFTMWQRQPGEEGKRFEQEIELCGPDGEVITSRTSQFEMIHAFYRVTSVFVGFPVGQFGPYTLKLYLREDKDGEEKREVGSFPLSVSRWAATE